MLPDELLLATVIEQEYLTLEEKTQQIALQHIALIKELTGYNTFFTGSRAICPGYCTPNSDWDYIALVHREYLDQTIVDDKWWVNGIGTASCQRKGFVSCKFKENEKINLILTDKQKFYDGFVKATNLAKTMHLPLKEQRIRFFSAIMGEKVSDTRISYLPPDQRISDAL